MKGIRSSLTLRIFAITSLLLIAASAVTYALIARLTPISYTALLADELEQATQVLLGQLSEHTAETCAPLIDRFVQQTGAKLLLIADKDDVLYDTLIQNGEVMTFWAPELLLGEANDVSGTIQQEASGINRAPDTDDGEPAEADYIAETGEAIDIRDDDPFPEEIGVSGHLPVDVQYMEEISVAGESDTLSISNYSFAFSDGTPGELTIQGGLRAVNQAAQALDRLLAPLLAIMLAFSLLGSFFYARFITRPIVSLSQIARRLAGLDFSARWNARRSDEIGVLGDSLNLMSDNLSGALSELQTANEALQRDIERERELERQRLAFFSAASHELKTPVTILRGQLSGMLAQVGVYRDREKYLARALEVTGRMESLIREILTISRIESGGFALPAERVEIGALLEEQIELDRELIDERALRLETDIRPGCFIGGSRGLLANALDNVLMNAILYSPCGAVVRVRLIDRELCVESTGAALPEDALNQLFTPFYRVEQSRNRKSGGSGLGLYLVQKILALHGADCGIENIEDGVRFWARLP